MKPGEEWVEPLKWISAVIYDGPEHRVREVVDLREKYRSDIVKELRARVPACIPPHTWDDCNECMIAAVEHPGELWPDHRGMPGCRSGSIASGGNTPHCTCRACF